MMGYTMFQTVESSWQRSLSKAQRRGDWEGLLCRHARQRFEQQRWMSVPVRQFMRKNNETVEIIGSLDQIT